MKQHAASGHTGGNKIALIGTGPVSLLKALFLAEQNPGNSITLIDRANQPGGAWYSDQSPGGHEIECGCHIWSYTPKAYRYIEKELGIPLFPMKPHPVFIGRRLNVPYSVKNTLHSYKTLVKLTAGLRWGKLRSMQVDPNINFRIVGKKNRYPANGSPALIHAILKKLQAYPQVQLLLNTEISAVHLDHSAAPGHHVQLHTSDGTVRHFDRLYMTYLSQLGTVSMDKKPLEVVSDRVDYIHFLIRLNRPLRKKVSYWRLMSDPVVHRITDISYQTDFKEHLLLVGIKGRAFHSHTEQELMSKVCALMTGYRLIDERVHCEHIKTHLFPAHYLGTETLRELAGFGEQVELMHTTDLMHGIYFLLKEEGKI